MGNHAMESDPMGCREERVALKLLLFFHSRQMLSTPQVVAHAWTRRACVLHGCFGWLCMHRIRISHI